MSDNRLLVLEDVLTGVVNERNDCNLVTVSDAFAYDFGGAPETCDLVVGSVDDFKDTNPNVYPIPFVYRDEKSEVFSRIAVLALRGVGRGRFFGMTRSDTNPVFYRLDNGRIVPKPYDTTTIDGLRGRLRSDEMEKISSFIRSLRS